MENGSELGPTYKSLFIAACGIIGGCFGWWLTHFVSAFERFQADVFVTESELRREINKLEARTYKLEWESEHKREKIRGD